VIEALGQKVLQFGLWNDVEISKAAEAKNLMSGWETKVFYGRRVIEAKEKRCGDSRNKKNLERRGAERGGE
jgi:hypothetical protein